MANICKCTLGKRNTQANTCPDLMAIASRIIIVPKYKADGTVNEFANEAAVTKAALAAKFDAADIDDRFFALADFKNVENTKAETVFEEFTDKSKVKIDEGKRTVVGHIINQGSRLLEKIKSWGCQEFGIYIIDKNSNFVYITDATTKLKVLPIAVDNNSFEAMLITATDTTIQKIKISFDFNQNMYDEYLRYIAFEDLDFDGISSSDVYGLLDVDSAISAISGSHVGFTATLTTDYGLPVKGLGITDFALYNVTDAAPLSIATCTESADGVYVFTYVATTASDVLRLTPTKSKYDFSNVIATTIIS